MDLQKFFHPSSIAIVGVSTTPTKVGHLVAKKMLEQGYTGKLYFVNPKGEEILGQKTYKDIVEVGKNIDLVILAIPAEIAIHSLDQVNQIGCKNVVLFAAGFKENADKVGDLHEKELLSKCEKYGITLLGPNCIGFINTKDKINATFLRSSSPSGNIGMMSQSGALGSILVDYFAAHKNLGFSYFISLGNKSIIDESDTLEFLAQNKNTEVIGLYLEDIKDGARFKKILAETTKIKPVVVLKGGTTDEGSKAAMSHTGGMVGDDQAFDAMCKEAGAMRAANFTEFTTILRMCSFKQLPTSANVLVLSNAGGAGVLLADELIQEKLKLVTVSEETKKALTTAFDAMKKITVHNPIDLLGDASAFDYEKAIRATLNEKDIGCVVILLTPQANTEIEKTAEIIIKAQQQFDYPIFPVFMGEQSVTVAHEMFEKAKITSFFMYDLLPSAIAKIVFYQQHTKQHQQRSLKKTFASLPLAAHELDIKTILLNNDGKPFLNQYDSLKVLEYAGVETIPTYLAHTEDDLQNIINKTGFPVVAKIATDKITHKTEVKGVVTDINTFDELAQAFSDLQVGKNKNSGCYIQQQLSGHELFIGVKRDPKFGPVVIVGLGGVYAELMKEIMYCVYPFSYEYFVEKLQQTKLNKLLEGFRKTKPINVEKLYEFAVQVGMLIDTFDQIKELDINPLFADGNKLKVVDARIIL